MSGGTVSPRVAVTQLCQKNLVTRFTGRAVRLGIERMMADAEGSRLTVLDFRDVEVIDFSCADEVVAKLVLGAAARPERDRFFLFRGMAPDVLDPVESALRRRALAVAAERRGGEPLLLGSVDLEGREVWEALSRCGRLPAVGVAERLGVTECRARDVLDGLYGRRLLLRRDSEYVSLSFAFARPEADATA
ncbi:MAG: hypothetical protein ACE5HF_01610 [Gemmatimonadota bacterium]